MSRILVSFLVGSFVTVGCMIAADYRTGLLLMAGGIVMLAIQGVLIASVSRARALSRFIEAVCDSLDQKEVKCQSRVEREHAPFLQQHGAMVSEFHQNLNDVSSALVNLGVAKKRAVSIASRSVADGGSLQDMIRRATAAARAN